LYNDSEADWKPQNLLGKHFISDYLLDLIGKEEDSIRFHKNQYYHEFKRLGMNTAVPGYYRSTIQLSMAPGQT
jgi:hypothetical protein